MFPEAVRAVRETKPQDFDFENVKGLLRKSFSSYFNKDFVWEQFGYISFVTT